MKLVSLRIEPRGREGWASDELIFGPEVTELFGPNGCGKTPLLQAVIYCLGHPVRFRDDFIQHCAATILYVLAGESEWTITRDIEVQFHVRVQRGEEVLVFHSERDYSDFLLPHLGFQIPALVSFNREAIRPYLSTLLPIFYIDQDHGYTAPYFANTSFIRDQYAEMLRIAFRLPPKNSFDQRKAGLERRRRLEELDKLVADKEIRILEKATVLGSRRELSQAQAELGDFEAQLRTLQESGLSSSDAQISMEAMLSESLRASRELKTVIADRDNRIASQHRTASELEVEINTLSLNEEARRLFSSFSEICSQPGCGLFLKASVTYGKSLLYLRDQMKDLERITEIQRVERASAQAKVIEGAQRIDDLRAQLDKLRKRENSSAVMESIERLSNRVFELRKEVSDLHDLNIHEQQYIAALNERSALQDQIAGTGRNPGSNELGSLGLRANLRERIIHWLGVLRTVNVSVDLGVDADFTVDFGGEKLSQLRGSTLVRAVLAIRAAVFELYCRQESSELKLLVLDTPRQQDIEEADLANFVMELKAVAVQYSAQIVFSTTEYRYHSLERDREWVPQFAGLEQRMFLNDPEITGQRLYFDEGGARKIEEISLGSPDGEFINRVPPELKKVAEEAISCIRAAWAGRMVERGDVIFGVPDGLFKINLEADRKAISFQVKGELENFREIGAAVGLRQENQRYCQFNMSEISQAKVAARMVQQASALRDRAT